MNAANLKETQEALAQQGLQVKFRHLRRFKPKEYPNTHITLGMFRTMSGPEHAISLEEAFELDPRGGTTVCQFWTTTETPRLVIDVAIRVHPLDNYDKRIGRTKALGVALSRLKQLHDAAENGDYELVDLVEVVDE